MTASYLREGFRFYNRLQRPTEFAAVFASNNKSSDEVFLFLARKNGTDIARLGVTVPKRHITKAVDRNHAKRIIRESFRLQKKKLKGMDVVVLVKKEINKNKSKYADALNRHWEKVTE